MMISLSMKSLAVLAMTLIMTVSALPYGPKAFNFTTNLDHYSSGGNSKQFNLRYIVDA